MNQRRFIFVNRFYAPDLSATSQLLTELTAALAKRGLTVLVITGRASYSGGKALLPANDVIAGVAVHRVAGTWFGRGRTTGRLMDYLTFHLFATLMLIALTRRNDVVIAKTDPPLICVPAWAVCKSKGALLINWLQDVFPEVLTSTLLAASRPPIWLRMITRLRDASLNSALANVVIGELMARRIEKIGVRRDAIKIIENWTDGSFVRPVARATNQLVDAWNLTGRFVVGYSGNLGIAHEFSTIVEAATQLREDRHIVFLFVGSGALAGPLRAIVKERGLTNVEFRPFQDRSHLAETLSVPDVHLVCLKPELEGLIVPSKFYGILAAGRPCIFIGDPNGELAMQVRTAGCGAAVQGGDAKNLSEIIRRLSSSPGEIATMGCAARHLLERQFDFSIAVQKWTSVLNDVTAAQRNAA